jgi:dTMP kinase
MSGSPAGLFVTFEGVEGAGKTTQIALLRDLLQQSGYSVCVTREPGGDAVAETVRRLLLEQNMSPRSELLLFLASRAQNVDTVIRPHLSGGGVVLCDRFIDSSIAYQGHARGLGREIVFQLNRFATDGLVPDLTILLDLPPSIGLTRQTNRNRMESESIEFHERVREGFLLEAANYPARFCVLDALQDAATLHDAIRERVTLQLEDRTRFGIGDMHG